MSEPENQPDIDYSWANARRSVCCNAVIAVPTDDFPKYCTTCYGKNPAVRARPVVTASKPESTRSDIYG